MIIVMAIKMIKELERPTATSLVITRNKNIIETKVAVLIIKGVFRVDKAYIGRPPEVNNNKA